MQGTYAQVQETSYGVASSMCASARNVIIPTPPHPNPTRNILWRSIKHVCKCKERHHPHPTPPQQETSYGVASSMCVSARNVIIPTPPHPNPTRNILWRSIKHVCKCKERHHPHPTPPQQETSYGVASSMCVSARNVIIPTPPHPNPTRNILWRSIKHVCKCKERHHPHPTPPQPTPTRNIIWRSIKHVCECKERHHPHPTPPPTPQKRALDEKKEEKQQIPMGSGHTETRADRHPEGTTRGPLIIAQVIQQGDPT